MLKLSVPRFADCCVAAKNRSNWAKWIDHVQFGSFLRHRGSTALVLARTEPPQLLVQAPSSPDTTVADGAPIVSRTREQLAELAEGLHHFGGTFPASTSPPLSAFADHNSS
jgi:hypothetical protein